MHFVCDSVLKGSAMKLNVAERYIHCCFVCIRFTPQVVVRPVSIDPIPLVDGSKAWIRKLLEAGESGTVIDNVIK